MLAPLRHVDYCIRFVLLFVLFTHQQKFYECVNRPILFFLVIEFGLIIYTLPGFFSISPVEDQNYKLFQKIGYVGSGAVVFIISLYYILFAIEVGKMKDECDIYKSMARTIPNLALSEMIFSAIFYIILAIVIKLRN